MRHPWTLLLAAVLAMPSLLHAAADPRIGADAARLTPAVTLSRAGLTTYAAYTVSVTNGATNDLRDAYFRGSLSNVGGSDAVVFVNLPAGCTGEGTSSVDCQFGLLAPGATSSTVTLVAKAPSDGQQIALNYIYGGFEGKGGDNGCCSQSGTALPVDLVDATVTTEHRRKMTSFVLPQGGTFFTGDAAVSSTVDGWTTQVVVPPNTQQQVMSIVEEPTASCGAAAVANGCFRTIFTLPGSYPGELKISFRWDKSLFNLSKGQVPELRYTKTPGVTAPFALQLCGPSGPAAGVPCLASAPRKITNQDQPTPPKELWGDLIFEVRALDNGVYEN